MIRERFAAGSGVRFLVSDGVYEYMVENRLYEGISPASEHEAHDGWLTMMQLSAMYGTCWLFQEFQEQQDLPPRAAATEVLVTERHGFPGNVQTDRRLAPPGR